jgi:FMN reductase
MSVLLLGGSPATHSGSARLLRHVAHRLAVQGHRSIELLVRDLPPRALMHADATDEAIGSAIAAVAGADAIVVATPVYKASYTGILKAFLDLLPQDGLAGKLVLPMATGGSQSHMLAIDYALRPVLAALSARFILPSIYVTSDQLEWIEESGLMLAAPIAERIAHGVDQLSSELNALPRHLHAATVLRHTPIAATIQ